MPKANTVSSVFVNHLGIFRGRFQGSGQLLVTAFGLRQASFEELPNITLIEATDDYMDTLGNFQKQKIQVEFAVNDIDEWFNVGDVVSFIKPVASSNPY